jgi:hypothetical protein
VREHKKKLERKNKRQLLLWSVVYKFLIQKQAFLTSSQLLIKMVSLFLLNSGDFNTEYPFQRTFQKIGPALALPAGKEVSLKQYMKLVSGKSSRFAAVQGYKIFRILSRVLRCCYSPWIVA